MLMVWHAAALYTGRYIRRVFLFSYMDQSLLELFMHIFESSVSGTEQ